MSLGEQLLREIERSGESFFAIAQGANVHHGQLCWSGEGSVPIEGTFVMVVNVEDEAGFVQAEWTDRNGEWVYQQQEFIHPEHLSGVRIGRSRDDVQTEINYGVINNVYLHGDTAAGMPVLPTLFTHVAAWGPALVARNGELFLNPATKALDAATLPIGVQNR